HLVAGWRGSFFYFFPFFFRVARHPCICRCYYIVIYRFHRTQTVNQNLSSIRSRLAEAQQALQGLLQDCFGREPLRPGSLDTLRRKCGKPNSRCARGEPRVAALYKELGAFDSDGLFIADGTYLFVPDNPRYEGSQ